MLTISLVNTQKQWRFDNKPVVRVGRNPENEVVLDVDLISRVHLELHQIESQQWQLISRGTNGTFVNGQSVQKLTLTDGMQVQLARGGPILQFRLQNVSVPTPSTSVSTPAQQAPPTPQPTNQEVSQIQTELERVKAAYSELEIILVGINAQFPPDFFHQRQQQIAKRLGEIQQLQANLQTQMTLLQQQPQPGQQALLEVLAATKNDLDSQRQSLEEFQTRMQQVQKLLERFEKHLKANHNISQQLQQGTRANTLIASVRQRLQELDQELGRIHEQHLLNHAKQTLGF